ncbi:hypothetical protein GCM10010123_15680 [Pilimelia anulata]|uniref:Uncharacterized protein n=1 Tax=Pilimelia anulata TaxID=53371 RepID=A0A8J3F8A5_9ACTN|nr:hypothetical protein [Pilimelia anulata]GGJ86954.1 hypothetical protein GCM10010123_15680 [Pilimelia anulata]
MAWEWLSAVASTAVGLGGMAFGWQASRRGQQQAAALTREGNAHGRALARDAHEQARELELLRHRQVGGESARLRREERYLEIAETVLRCSDAMGHAPETPAGGPAPIGSALGDSAAGGSAAIGAVTGAAAAGGGSAGRLGDDALAAEVAAGRLDGPPAFGGGAGAAGAGRSGGAWGGADLVRVSALVGLHATAAVRAAFEAWRDRLDKLAYAVERERAADVGPVASVRDLHSTRDMWRRQGRDARLRERDARDRLIAALAADLATPDQPDGTTPD